MINPHTGKPFKTVDEMTGTVITFKKGHAPVVTSWKSPILLGRPYQRRDPRTIPPREWLYGRSYIRKCLSVMVAPGGTGKSTLALTEAIAMATGRNLLGDTVPGGRQLTVWYWNGEDPRDEIERRIEAICIEHRISAADLGERLIISDAGSDEIMLATRVGKDGAEINEDCFAAIEATIKTHGVDLAIFDPFISTHRIGESDNGAIDMVAKRLARMAMNLNVGVGLIHHARKPISGGSGEVTMADSRGASSLIDCARIGRVLNFMSEQEATDCGVPPEDRRRYVRIDDGKANLSPRVDKARWVHLESISLGNETPEQPADFVGVPVQWEMPGVFEEVKTSHLIEVQRRADRARQSDTPLRADTQSPEWIGHEVASVLGLDIDASGAKLKVKKIVAVWIENKALKVERLPDEKRRMRNFVVVDEWANTA